MHMCLFPRLVKNPKYKANKKNGGNVPEIKDNRVLAVPIGCGMCIECMKQKANNWRVRLAEDIKEHKNAKFVTLTFNNEEYRKLLKEIREKADVKGYELDNAIAKKAVRRFLERWRKKYKKSLRHWLVTELGGNGTENIHLHGILYTDNVEDIERIWSYGYCWTGTKKIVKGADGIMRAIIQNYTNEKTINYITKYVTKVDLKHKYYKPLILCSAGIGANYTKTYNFKNNKYNGQDTKETYKNSKGYNIALPVYWRNKAYSEEERERLWLNKLDKNVRYVMGEKIDISKGEEEYYRTLEHYRELNKQLGYGSPKNWKARQYEQERRILKQKERLSKN